MTTNYKTLPLEDDYKTTKSKGSATLTGYTIEARFHVREPEKIGRQIYDKEWRQVEFDKSVIGVPMSNIYHRELLEHGLFRDQLEWITCSDGKSRPTQPGIFPLVDGISKSVVRGGDRSMAPDANQSAEARTMRLKGYGNAIVPQVAALFITAAM